MDQQRNESFSSAEDLIRSEDSDELEDQQNVERMKGKFALNEIEADRVVSANPVSRKDRDRRNSAFMDNQ